MAAEPQSSASTEPEREVTSRGTQCDATDTVSRGTQAQYLPEVSSRGTQVQEAALVEVVSRGTQVAGLVESSSASPAAAMDTEEKEWEEWEETSHKLVTTAQSLGIAADLSEVLHICRVSLQCSGSHSAPRVHESTKSWSRHYSALAFLLNGHLYAEYEKLSGMLGLPSCSHTTWHKMVEDLEVHVSNVAEWSCRGVRDAIEESGNKNKWVASFDGFYLTRGHHSNNCSATIHDYETGKIAWFCHRTKRGLGHNWEGTSGGAEGHMFDELIGKVKEAGFVITEMITDKDSSVNAIFCKYFPESTITYCANHCAKTMHRDLQQVKQVKCEVRRLAIHIYKPNHLYVVVQGRWIQMQKNGRSLPW